MALSANDAFAAVGRRRRRGAGRRAALSEINVTPLVDVMLVLLIVFMVSAPLLTAGVPLDLPQTDAAAMNDQTEPVTVSIQQSGAVFVGETPATLDQVADRVRAAAGGQGSQRPVYVRADGHAPYEAVARVMARLTTAGFTRVGLLTETGGDAAPAPAAAALAPAAAPEGGTAEGL